MDVRAPGNWFTSNTLKILPLLLWAYLCMAGRSEFSYSRNKRLV